MNKPMTRFWLVLMAAMTLALAGCSDTAGEQGAKDKVEQQEAVPAEQENSAESSQPEASEPTSTVEPDTEAAPDTAAAEKVCGNCGTISVIAPVHKQGGPPEFVGTIVGGVAGAAIGHQIGSGSGKTIATIVGAIGGALAGHEVQQRVTTARLYKVTVRMDAGGTRTITVPSAKQISEGMRVRVRNGNIVLM